MTITFDDVTFHNVGLRLKGNSSLVNSWRSGVEKLPFRLNFDELEDPYPEIRDQTFFGFPNLNLTNNSQDASFLRAKVVGDLFLESGVSAARTAFVRVFLDRGEGTNYLGLYTLVEVPDAPMLVAQFGSSDGNLYKPAGTGARWTIFDPESFPKKTNERDEDWTDIEDAIEVLHESRASPEVWRTRLEARFGVASFLRWLALNTIIGNTDTGTDSVRPRAANIRARAAQGVTVGGSWRLTRWVRLMGNAGLERFSEPRSAPDPARTMNPVLAMRLQFELP